MCLSPLTHAFSRPNRRTAMLAAALLTALGGTLLPGSVAHAADTSVTVDFATAGGAPTYHASGTLYGMTPDGSLPQDHFYEDINWHLERAGGAQLNSGGYATSLADYQTRWNATLAQYKRTAALGNTQDYQLVAAHSGKCVDVTAISTTPGALIHQWTCDTGNTLTTKKNQIWRLQGKN